MIREQCAGAKVIRIGAGVKAPRGCTGQRGVGNRLQKVFLSFANIRTGARVAR
jgi:hypothetical protein